MRCVSAGWFAVCRFPVVPSSFCGSVSGAWLRDAGCCLVLFFLNFFVYRYFDVGVDNDVGLDNKKAAVPIRKPQPINIIY